MVCMNCITGYLSHALPVLVPLFLWFSRNIFKSKNIGNPLPPVYGPWYLPSFVRGILAMIRLGADEDLFLLSLRRLYGPVVYLPWPLCQIFVLEGDVIQRVYSSPSTTLSFLPIRVSMQHSVFGTSQKITSTPIMHEKVFPIHAKGLTTVRLDTPIRRFINAVEASIVELGHKIDAAGGALETGLVRWAVDTMFDAASAALFGEDFMARMQKDGLRGSFAEFDAAFPLLTAELIPSFLIPFIPPIARGIKGRERLFTAIATWVEDGMPGLDEGVVQDMAQIGLTEGHSSREIATFLTADLWALQANTPYAAAALLLYIIQSTLLPAVREEIDSIPTKGDSITPHLDMKTLSSLELVASCVQETLRLNSSSFSIRIVEESFVLSVSQEDAKGTPPGGFFIPGGSRIICATRTAHLSDRIWGEGPSTWDGERFLERGDDGGTKSEKARAMRGFGGGISICEGRHLASAELKAFLALTLSAFDITPLYPTMYDGVTPLPSSSSAPTALSTQIRGMDEPVISPRRAEGRPGLGVFQFDGSDVVARIVRRR